MDLLHLHRAKERLLEDALGSASRILQACSPEAESGVSVIAEALSGGRSHEAATKLTMDDLKRFELSLCHSSAPSPCHDAFSAFQHELAQALWPRLVQSMPVPANGRPMWHWGAS